MSNLDKKYSVNLDLINNIKNENMKFSLSDNETSDFYIKITKSMKSIDLTDKVVNLYVVKPNKNVIYTTVNLCTESDETNLFYCDLPNNFKNIKGSYYAQIAIEDMITGEKVVIPSKFSYTVESDIISEAYEAVDTEENKNILDLILSDLIELKANKITINDTTPGSTTVYSGNKIEKIKEELSSQISAIGGSGGSGYTHPATHPASMITGLSTVATSGNYEDLTDKPIIPTRTSQLSNDSDFVDSAFVSQKIAEASLSGGEVDLSGYVTKETGNASQITFSDGQTFQAKLDAGTLKGDKGDTGAKGEKGDKGEPGIQGPKGDKGDSGVSSIDDTTASATTVYSGNKIEKIKEELSSQIAALGSTSNVVSNAVLPRVYLVGNEFSNMTAEKNEVNMQLAYRQNNNNFDANIKIKFQGSSSMAYPKKNFTIKMYTDNTYETKLKKQFKSWGINANKYVLKANWIDRTHARNIISARIWGDIVKTRKTIPPFMQNCPNTGAIDGFPIKVFVNGAYQGMYTWNLGKDSYLFNFTDQTNSFICCAESNAGMFYDTTGWTVEYPDIAPESWTTLISNFVNFINDSTDEQFKANFNQYADLASFIDYYIFAYSNCGLDSLGKNMILVSDTGDKLYASAYDLDSTWGLFWNGSTIVDSNYPCPDSYQENNSALWKRFEPIFKDEIYNRYVELTGFGMPLNPVNLIERFEEFNEIITDDLMKEDKEIFTELPTVGSYKQIRNFINERKIYVDECMQKIKDGTMHVGAQIESISINESINQLTQGSTAQLTVSTTPSDISGYTVVWSSNNDEVATVSTNGLVTGVGIGEVTITAKVGEKTASITLSIIENKSALTIQINANTGYMFANDNDINVGTMTTSLPIDTTKLGYKLTSATEDYSSIVKCGDRPYVKGNLLATTDEECISAGWGKLWIRILNETLNGANVKDWAVNNNLEFTFDLTSVNKKWADYTLPTNLTWSVDTSSDTNYYAFNTTYSNVDGTDIQFDFPSTWYNKDICQTAKNYFGNTAMSLYKQNWSGYSHLVLIIEKSKLSANTSEALNEYLSNNPIVLKYIADI